MKYLTQYVPQGSGISDGYVAIEEAGVLKAQKLSFDRTTATPDGTAEVIDNIGLFATGMDEPAYEGGTNGGGSCKYYKCASVDTANKTWSGYELILQDGVYTVSETMTEGLTYVGFIPFADRIYSEDGMLEVSSFYKGVQLVSPTGMTSAENDEWVISASSVYVNDPATYGPYNAFSGSDTETYGWIPGDYAPHTTFPHWIKWQNKNTKSKITEYAMQVNGWVEISNRERFPGSWVLQGSNDGVSWVTVDDRTNEITDYSKLETFKYYNFMCQNPDYYYYYRLYISAAAKSSEPNFVYIGQIKAYGQFE